MPTMNRKYFAISFIAIAAMIIALSAGPVFAHGGHGKPEEQFDIVPEKIESPGKVVIKMGNIQITRQEFFDYIQNVGAFQMKADLLQRDFLLHYWVVEGLSRYYPSDINELMPRLIEMGMDKPEYRGRMDEWVLAQASLYPRMLYYYKKAIATGLDKKPEIHAVLECFANHVKADFMEDFVTYGTAVPTKLGVREYVAGLSAKDRKNIEGLYTDPKTVSPSKRKIAQKRWIEYRSEMMSSTPHERSYLKVDSLSVPPTTAIAKVNNNSVPLKDFLAVYGPIPNDVAWNNIKKSRGSKLLLAYAMAGEVDHLKILTPRFKKKIELSKKFYLISDQIVREYGPLINKTGGKEIDFAFFREVVAYLNLLKLEKEFIKGSEKLPEYETLWVDSDYLKSIKWKIDKAYTPKQPKYF